MSVHHSIYQYTVVYTSIYKYIPSTYKYIPVYTLLTWLMSRIWWAEFLLSNCFLLETRLQQFLTCSISTRIQASRMAVPTLLQQTDGGAAMSMRSTRGCGSLGVASPAWEAWPSRRPQKGKMLWAMHGTSVQQRQYVIARRLQPDSKYTVLYDSMYEYVRVY